MPRNDLCIDILGTRITIAAEEEASYLEEILKLYRRKVMETQKKTGLRDPLKIAIITGFSLCDEIKKIGLRLKAEDSEESEVERIAENIISRIDAVVEGRETAPERKHGDL